MRILIIENETLAAEQLKNMICNIKSNCSFLPVATSIREAVLILSSTTPDLVFMDIELSDGIAFDIFNAIEVKSPVVFTTAFNQYITNAFDNNGIAYLLKPLKAEMVEKAFQNLQKKSDIFHATGKPHQVLKELQATQWYRSQFLVKQGQKLIPVKTSEINHFFCDEGLTYLITLDKRKYAVSESLGDLEELLNPNDFFRVNRKFIVSKNAILFLNYHSKGQVKVNINLLEPERIIVSRQQTTSLKTWLNS